MYEKHDGEESSQSLVRNFVAIFEINEQRKSLRRKITVMQKQKILTCYSVNQRKLTAR